MNHDTARGKEIYQAILKAAYQALFSLGVKSPENVDKFILNLESNLGKEFLRIGVYQLEEPARPTTQTSPPEEPTLTPPQEQPIRAGTDAPVADSATITTDVHALALNNLTERRLRLANLATVEALMEYMKSASLTTIKGIKEKSASEILLKLSLWQAQS